MVKAKITYIRVGLNASTYSVSVDFPEFPAPGGTTQTLVFDVTQEDYQAWTPPDGVDKNPSNFLEYEYIRPAYDKIKAIHQHFKPLKNREFDW